MDILCIKTPFKDGILKEESLRKGTLSLPPLCILTYATPLISRRSDHHAPAAIIVGGESVLIYLPAAHQVARCRDPMRLIGPLLLRYEGVICCPGRRPEYERRTGGAIYDRPQHQEPTDHLPAVLHPFPIASHAPPASR